MGLALAQGQGWLAKRAEDLPAAGREFIGLSVICYGLSAAVAGTKAPQLSDTRCASIKLPTRLPSVEGSSHFSARRPRP
jgi:hypothetical protein